jgi:hypothetical protein
MPPIVRSKVPAPLRVLRLASCSSRGPSMLTPTVTRHSRIKSHHSLSSSMPLVWNAWNDRDRCRPQPFDRGEGLAIERRRRHERLAGMPHHGDLR